MIDPEPVNGRDQTEEPRESWLELMPDVLSFLCLVAGLILLVEVGLSTAEAGNVLRDRTGPIFITR
jgi:hypothetical protein